MNPLITNRLSLEVISKMIANTPHFVLIEICFKNQQTNSYSRNLFDYITTIYGQAFLLYRLSGWKGMCLQPKYFLLWYCLILVVVLYSSYVDSPGSHTTLGSGTYASSWSYVSEEQMLKGFEQHTRSYTEFIHVHIYRTTTHNENV